MPCSTCVNEARCDRAGLCQDFARQQLRSRPCTCHPDDNPPQPCQRKYSLSECFVSHLQAVQVKDAA